MTEKSKFRKTLERCVPIAGGIIGGTIGVTIIGLMARKGSVWNIYRLKPDQLQDLIDNPDAVIVFENMCTMVGNSTSSEV